MKPHNAFYWMGAFLASLSLVLLYIQFLVGDDDQSIRDRLHAWYDDITKGDWVSLITFVTRSIDGFFTYIFGKQIISWRYVLTALTISGFINFLSFLSPLNKRKQ